MLIDQVNESKIENSVASAESFGTPSVFDGLAELFLEKVAKFHKDVLNET